MHATQNRAALEAERKRLQDRLDAIKADMARGLDRDSSEQAIELENAEVLQEIARVTQDELDRVEIQLRSQLP